jgi:hypothetical protein
MRLAEGSFENNNPSPVSSRATSRCPDAALSFIIFVEPGMLLFSASKIYCWAIAGVKKDIPRIKKIAILLFDKTLFMMCFKYTAGHKDKKAVSILLLLLNNNINEPVNTR